MVIEPDTLAFRCDISTLELRSKICKQNYGKRKRKCVVFIFTKRYAQI